MKIEEIINKDLERKYHITIDPKALDDFMNQEARAMSTTSKMDGFRPGKTPTALIRSTHKYALQTKAIEHFVELAITKIVADHKIKLASQPILHDLVQEETKLSFSLEMELLPEIPTLDIEKIKLEKYICEVGEKETKQTEDEFLKMHRSFNTSENAAKLGDITVIDAVGYMNGKEFEGGKVLGHRLELGSKTFIDGFEAGLVGVKAGDSKKLKLKFPENYHMKDYSNKPVEFEVTVKEVLEAKAAKIDDELVKKLQAKDKQEIKDRLKESAQGYYDNLSELIMRRELLDHLDKQIKMKLPPKLLAKEIEAIKHSEELKEQNDKEIQKIAERRTKLGLLMAKTSQENHISVSEDDIRSEVTKQIQRMPAQAQAIIEYYRQNPSAAEALRGQILENKTMLFMLGKVQTTQKKVTPEKISEIYSEIIKRPIE